MKYDRILRSTGICAAVAFTSACMSGRPAPAGEVPAASLVLTQRVEHIDVVAREPMVVEHPNGTLFVAGYGSPRPTLWKSVDRGATWRRVDVGRSAAGNSDVDLAMARDGTLYFVSMTYDRTVGEGRQIAVGVSTNAGANWLWSTLSNHRFDDRPWIDVAPNGVVHVIWNDGAGVLHALSRDRGLTWTHTGRVHDRGGSSHMAIGPRGEVAVRITPASASGNKFDPGADLIAVSTDDGATWHDLAAPGDRDWNPGEDVPGVTPRWVEPLAWDDAGRLYSLWTEKTGVHLARSSDRGASWTKWLVAPASAQCFFPYLIARGPGQLAATWFSASAADFKDLQWHLARIDVDEGSAEPRVIQAPPQPLESARPRRGDGDTVYNDTGGEYLAIAALRDGSLAVVTPIQNKAAQRMGFSWWKYRR